MWEAQSVSCWTAVTWGFLPGRGQLVQLPKEAISGSGPTAHQSEGRSSELGGPWQQPQGRHSWRGTGWCSQGAQRGFAG